MVRCFVEGSQLGWLIVVVNKARCNKRFRERGVNGSSIHPPPLTHFSLGQPITFHSTLRHHLHHQYYCICVLHQKPALLPVSPRATSMGALRCAQFTAGGRSFYSRFSYMCCPNKVVLYVDQVVPRCTHTYTSCVSGRWAQMCLRKQKSLTNCRGEPANHLYFCRCHKNKWHVDNLSWCTFQLHPTHVHQDLSGTNSSITPDLDICWPTVYRTPMYGSRHYCCCCHTITWTHLATKE